MNDTTLEVLLEMQDNATPQLQAFGAQVQTVTAETQQMGPRVTAPLSDIGTTLANNRRAIRELASGVMYLGGSFLAMGVSMQMSNNQAMKSAGSMLTLVGGVMATVGASVQFIGAISRMIDALKKLQIAEIIAKAFSGPAGWAMLAAGGAIAGGAVYGLSRYQGAETKVAKAEAKSAQTSITVHQHIAGSVVTERQLTDNVQKGLLLKGQRSYTTGVR